MDELTKIALVGTSKFAASLPAADHPAVALVADRADDDRERSLLLRCGARAVYDLAGRQAVTGIEPMAPAPPETLKTASRKLAGMLQAIYVPGNHGLLIDCLVQMNQRKVAVPPELLPALLPSTRVELRQCLVPLLGERGKWLCRQNPDWSHFLVNEPSQAQAEAEAEAEAETEAQAGPDLAALKQTWDEGTIDQRCRALETLRRHDLATARDWVAQVFAKEKANHRVKLVETFATALADDDEAFLESCLNDRSAAVGQAAAGLLCRLPRSALAGRMRSRALAILTIERKGLVLKKNTLMCTPPQEIDRDWERDGIVKRAPSGTGERAFWTERVLAAVPPSWWQSQFDLEPPALIAAVADDPFASSVVTGWTDAAVLFAPSDPASAAWLVPLWRHQVAAFGALPKEKRGAEFLKTQALLTAMTPEMAEAALAHLFDAPPGWDEAEVTRCLTDHRAPWSARFSAAFLATVRQRVRDVANEPALRWANALTAVACAIPAEAFPLALAPWELAAPGQTMPWIANSIREDIDHFLATITTRQDFLNELNASL
jgi:hypothetical protein